MPQTPPCLSIPRYYPFSALNGLVSSLSMTLTAVGVGSSVVSLKAGLEPTADGVGAGSFPSCYMTHVPSGGGVYQLQAVVSMPAFVSPSLKALAYTLPV